MQPRPFSVMVESEARLLELTNADLYKLYQDDVKSYVLVLQNINRGRGQVEHEQGAHPVIAEALPHLGEEQGAQPPRMAAERRRARHFLGSQGFRRGAHQRRVRDASRGGYGERRLARGSSGWVSRICVTSSPASSA